MNRILVGEWRSRGGKFWVNLYRDNHGFTYEGHGCGGVLGNIQTWQAFDEIETRVVAFFAVKLTRVPVPVTTHNRTNLSQAEIDACPVIGKTVSKWRQRDIELREYPDNPDRVISVGTTFDGRMVVICDEEREEWATALDYIKHGKVYVSE